LVAPKTELVVGPGFREVVPETEPKTLVGLVGNSNKPPLGFFAGLGPKRFPPALFAGFEPKRPVLGLFAEVGPKKPVLDICEGLGPKTPVLGFCAEFEPKSPIPDLLLLLEWLVLLEYESSSAKA
jgi:hypothetical protein